MQSDSKCIIRKLFIKLLSKRHIDLNEATFWEQFWAYSDLKLEDTFMLFTSGEVKKMKEVCPYNLAALCYKIIEKLYLMTNQIQNNFDPKTVLNCTNILTCILPQIYQDESWNSFFWSDLTINILSEIPLPLGKTLLSSICNLLFFPDFTIQKLNKQDLAFNLSEIDSCQYIWENGIGCSEHPKCLNYDAERVAIVRLLLVCLSYILYLSSPLNFKPLGTRLRCSTAINNTTPENSSSSNDQLTITNSDFDLENNLIDHNDLVNDTAVADTNDDVLLIDDNVAKETKKAITKTSNLMERTQFEFENIDLDAEDDTLEIFTSLNTNNDKINIYPNDLNSPHLDCNRNFSADERLNHQQSFESSVTTSSNQTNSANSSETYSCYENNNLSTSFNKSNGCALNPWIDCFSSSEQHNKHALAIFTSFINIVCDRGLSRYEAQMSHTSLSLKYLTVFRRITYSQDKNRDELVELSLHVLLAVLTYDIVALKLIKTDLSAGRRYSKSSAKSSEKRSDDYNIFAFYLSRLHDPIDFDFILKGMIGILNESLPFYNRSVPSPSNGYEENTFLPSPTQIGSFKSNTLAVSTPNSPLSVPGVNADSEKKSAFFGGESFNLSGGKKGFDGIGGVKDKDELGSLNEFLGSIYLSINPFVTRGPIKLSQLYQEIMVFLWVTCYINKKFIHHLMKSNKILDLIVPILYHLNESKSDPAKMGVLHVGIYVLLSLSAERNFGVRLNRPFNNIAVFKSTLPALATIKTPTYADLLITVIHEVIIKGNQVTLNNLYESLLIIIVNVSPYLKGLSMNAAKCLMHLLDGFARPDFMFLQPYRYRLTFFLLETLNNIVQYQFDSNSPLVYQIIRKRKIFFKLLNLPSDQAMLDTLTKNSSPNFPNEVRESISWKPNHVWVVKLKHRMPLQTILRLLEVLIPQIELTYLNNKAYDENEVVKFLQQGTLVGLLPVPHPILMRRYQPNKSTLLWFMTYVWGLIYLKNMDPPIWYETDVKLFQIKKL